MYDIIVIGAGPAGLNAALYALRGGKSVLIIEANNVGGQIANSPKFENFPTIKEISGMDFAIQFSEQVESWGGHIEYDKVTNIEKIENTFRLFFFLLFQQGLHRIGEGLDGEGLLGEPVAVEILRQLVDGLFPQLVQVVVQEKDLLTVEKVQPLGISLFDGGLQP